MTPPKTPIEAFHDERRQRIAGYHQNPGFQTLSRQWLEASMREKYVYNFDWLGRPIIQYPQDIVGYQELVWAVKPDLIIETGIAHGGSLILSASLLALLDYTDALTQGTVVDPSQRQRKVVGVDIDIRPHNREAIEAHPLGSLDPDDPGLQHQPGHCGPSPRGGPRIRAGACVP
ncbi:Cephalosporin hydroxylase, putative [Pararhodospirillum photometricum]|uniref:Cephalosporin hydroxylase, putative n=1 Tax=Pararhodospirillum photometricum DSM 122 TaxID=1150469 RepID=H6SSB7_PARPM|nr:Cephalosporin hydroxylase, putative [Pararhodospirillum photometricum]CCG07796.1 Cephalosporin hydroxylase, putative [Pararhodospirillum photometricum DSM 122]